LDKYVCDDIVSAVIILFFNKLSLNFDIGNCVTFNLSRE